MRDYLTTAGVPFSQIPTEDIQCVLETPGLLHECNVGFNGATDDKLGERLRIELLIRSLWL